MEMTQREVAFTIWATCFLAFSALNTDVRVAMLGVIRAFFVRAIIVTLLLMLLYVVLCVLVIYAFGLWVLENSKTTLVWVLAFALPSIMSSSRSSSHEPSPRGILRESVTFTALVLFLSESYNFSLPVELILTPVLFVLASAQVLADHDVRLALAGKIVGFVLGVFGGALIINGFWGAISDYRNFASINSAREFFTPVLLSIMFIPFLYSFRAFIAYEDACRGLRLRGVQQPILAYARTKAILKFGWNRDFVRRWRRRIVLDDPKTRNDVDAIIDELAQIREREGRRVDVAPERGWAPWRAQMFLADARLIANDYHRNGCEWFADSDGIDIGNRIFEARISYLLAGDADAVTRMKLRLQVSVPAERDVADEKFVEVAIHLLGCVGDSDPVQTMQDLRESTSCNRDGLQISLAFDSWGDEKVGGYSRTLLIRHQADNGGGF